jgi:Protein of unknown function (DUF1176)
LISRPDLDAAALPSRAMIHLVSGNGRGLAGGQFVAITGSNQAIEIPANQVSAFIRVARGASHAILVSGPNARPVFYISLSGLVASGRAMDAQQGRTGTLTALIDMGRRPASTVPPAPAKPVIVAQPFTPRARVAPPAALLRLRQSECDDSERYDPGATNITAYTLDRTRILWSVPCGAGAYNVWNRFYIQKPDRSLTPVSFTGLAPRDETDAYGPVNPSIDPQRGMVTAFSKGRGLGDCGTAETFAWSGQAFVLTSARAMLPCGGIISDFWPSLFTSLVQVKTSP